jgi:DNA invertase Pin-like site-specific DNA recombinase
MRIGYIRVSTDGQNTARQDEKMADCEKIFREKISGKSADRPQLQAMMDFVREGDVVIVESYSRFSRSTRDLLNLLEQLDKKGVSFVSLKENVDTSTPQGRLIMTIFAGLAQFEREQILQRQAEGIAIAKAQGKYKGRQPIKIDKDAFTEQVKQWKAGKATAAQAMRNLGLKPNTFYRRVKEMEG